MTLPANTNSFIYSAHVVSLLVAIIINCHDGSGDALQTFRRLILGLLWLKLTLSPS